MDESTIEQKIIEEIETLAGAKVKSVEEEIFTSGLLDSMNILNLVTFVEREFQIKLNTFDLDLDTFGSVKKIKEYVLSKING